MPYVISICIAIVAISITVVVTVLRLRGMEKDCEEEIKKIEEKELEKESLKGSLNSGNHTDDVNNMLDILRKQPKK